MVDIPASLIVEIFRVSLNRLKNLWVIVSDEVWVVFLNAIVENGDDDALASDPHLPRLLHTHVEPATPVQVPEVRLESILSLAQDNKSRGIRTT